MKRPSYIPILKWQKCEIKALNTIEPEIKGRLLPCIEIRKEKQRSDFFNSFQLNWSQPCIVDYGDPHGFMTGKRLGWLFNGLSEASRLNLPITFAINPLDPKFLENKSLSKANFSDKRLCIRIRLSSIQNIQYLSSTLQNFVQTFELLHFQVLIDLGETPSLPNCDVPVLVSFMRLLINLGAKSVHLGSGAYPGTLKNIGEGIGKIPRDDWLLWLKITNSCPDLGIGYSDYGSITPSWTEEDKQFRKGPLAIRYATQQDWLVVRGGSDKSEQAARNLASLFYFAFQSEFETYHFSIADTHLWQKANLNFKKLPKVDISPAGHTWEALDHHIAYVLKKQYQCETQIDSNRFGRLF